MAGRILYIRRNNILIGKIRINFRTIFLILLLIPFIQSRTYSEMPAIVGKLYKYGSLIVSTMVYFDVVRTRMKSYNINNSFLFFLFWVVYAFSTLALRAGSFTYVLYQAYVLFAMVLLVNRAIGKNPMRFMFAITFIYQVLTFANFILMIAFPNGLYEIASYYHTALLLGDDNAIAYVVIPGIVCSVGYSYLKYKKLTLITIADIVVAELSFIMTWSATAIVCCTLLIILLVLVLRDMEFSPYLYLVAFIVTVLLILFGTNLPFIEYFITNTLQKDITLGGRVYLWTRAIAMIAESPIWGHGGFFEVGKWQYGAWGINYPCHTPYLQILLDGGILLGAIFVAIIVTGFRKLNSRKNKKFAQILTVGIFCIMINYIFEYSGLFHLFILLSIAMNINKFDEI